MEQILIKTAKYLLMFLALAIFGFIVAIVGLLVVILSPLLPLFEKEISLLKDKENEWNYKQIRNMEKRKRTW